MLKVLQLIPTLDRAGAEKQMVLLARGLPRARFRVEVAALTRLGPLRVELEEAGIPITALGKRFKLDPLALTRLVQFLKAGQFDVVQTWIFAANTYGRIAARLARVPIVVTTEMAVDLWKGKTERSIDRRLARWCDRLVGNSYAVVEYYRSLGVPEDRLKMIYSGIAEEEPPRVDPAAVRAEFGFAAEAPLALFAGRLAEQKRVDDLLQALDLLQHVQPDLRTLIAGDGPLRSTLEENARLYHLKGLVRFLGHRADVARLMAAADLVVLPSAYEGLPNFCSKPCASASPWLPPRHPEPPRLWSTARPGYSFPWPIRNFWPGQFATSSVILPSPAAWAQPGANMSKQSFLFRQ